MIKDSQSKKNQIDKQSSFVNKLSNRYESKYRKTTEPIIKNRFLDGYLSSKKSGNGIKTYRSDFLDSLAKKYSSIYSNIFSTNGIDNLTFLLYKTKNQYKKRRLKRNRKVFEDALELDKRVQSKDEDFNNIEIENLTKRENLLSSNRAIFSKSIIESRVDNRKKPLLNFKKSKKFNLDRYNSIEPTMEDSKVVNRISSKKYSKESTPVLGLENSFLSAKKFLNPKVIKNKKREFDRNGKDNLEIDVSNSYLQNENNILKSFDEQRYQKKLKQFAKKRIKYSKENYYGRDFLENKFLNLNLNFDKNSLVISKNIYQKSNTKKEKNRDISQYQNSFRAMDIDKDSNLKKSDTSKNRNIENSKNIDSIKESKDFSTYPSRETNKIYFRKDKLSLIDKLVDTYRADNTRAKERDFKPKKREKNSITSILDKKDKFLTTLALQKEKRVDSKSDFFNALVGKKLEKRDSESLSLNSLFNSKKNENSIETLKEELKSLTQPHKRGNRVKKEHEVDSTDSYRELKNSYEKEKLTQLSTPVLKDYREELESKKINKNIKQRLKEQTSLLVSNTLVSKNSLESENFDFYQNRESFDREKYRDFFKKKQWQKLEKSYFKYSKNIDSFNRKKDKNLIKDSQNRLNFIDSIVKKNGLKVNNFAIDDYFYPLDSFNNIRENSIYLNDTKYQNRDKRDEKNISKSSFNIANQESLIKKASFQKDRRVNKDVEFIKNSRESSSTNYKNYQNFNERLERYKTSPFIKSVSELEQISNLDNKLPLFSSKERDKYYFNKNDNRKDTLAKRVNNSRINSEIMQKRDSSISLSNTKRTIEKPSKNIIDDIKNNFNLLSKLNVLSNPISFRESEKIKMNSKKLEEIKPDLSKKGLNSGSLFFDINNSYNLPKLIEQSKYIDKDESRELSKREKIWYRAKDREPNLNISKNLTAIQSNILNNSIASKNFQSILNKKDFNSKLLSSNGAFGRVKHQSNIVDTTILPKSLKTHYEKFFGKKINENIKTHKDLDSIDKLENLNPLGFEKERAKKDIKSDSNNYIDSFLTNSIKLEDVKSDLNEKDSKSKESFSTELLNKLNHKLNVGGSTILPKSLKTHYEKFFGKKINQDIKIHKNSNSIEQSQRVNALAFAKGNEIFFGKDIDIDSPQGKSLLVHELAHIYGADEAGATQAQSDFENRKSRTKQNSIISKKDKFLDTLGIQRSENKTGSITEFAENKIVQFYQKDMAIPKYQKPKYEDRMRLSGDSRDNLAGRTLGKDYLTKDEKKAMLERRKAITEKYRVRPSSNTPKTSPKKYEVANSSIKSSPAKKVDISKKYEAVKKDTPRINKIDANQNKYLAIQDRDIKIPKMVKPKNRGFTTADEKKAMLERRKAITEKYRTQIKKPVKRKLIKKPIIEPPKPIIPEPSLPEPITPEPIPNNIITPPVIEPTKPKDDEVKKECCSEKEMEVTLKGIDPLRGIDYKLDEWALKIYRQLKDEISIDYVRKGIN